jgi:mannan endo-1,4-beta-mannosidase
MPRTVRVSATGDDVKFLQDRLNQWPTNLPPLVVDGDFETKTRAQVMEYPRDHALVVNGEVGPETWTSLLGHQVTETPRFFTLASQLHDRLGEKVLLRGVNKMSVWDEDDPEGIVNFAEIKKTGANTVRIVWAMEITLEVGDPPVFTTEPTLPARLDTLITNAKANHLIPMIELHDATSDLDRLGDLVDYWARPDIVTIVKTHEQFLLLNIGNEVGDDLVTAAEFRPAYVNAVTRLRGAGIHVPLVIDAPDSGKNLEVLNDTAIALRNADPEGNLISSVHIYWAISDGADAAFIKSQLETAVAIDYPLIVGEFSRFGAYAGNASICSPAGEVDYKTILKVCDSLKLGWYAWEWGPGNEWTDPLCVVMNMTMDSKFASLQPGWAEGVATGSPFGIKSTSVTPASI